MKNMEYSATISSCKKYRYKLTRSWDRDKGYVLFIMLNPSTADASKDDLTTSRCINFAKKWGYGGIMIGNIWPFRAKRPKDLRKWLKNPYVTNGWPEAISANKAHVNQMASSVDLVVCAWGCNYKDGIPKNWELDVPLHYLELCDDGETPKHPLGNLSKDLVPIEYKLNTNKDG